MQYSVKLINISDNDQLVLRLIFSLSEKARGRSHAFCLAQDDTAQADICIAQPGDVDTLTATDEADIILLENSMSAGDNCIYQIRKPLIASRVLTILDRFINEQPKKPAEETADIASAPLLADFIETPDVTDTSEFEFCISEQEASELAIVDDEALSNPSNQQPAAQLDSAEFTNITSMPETAKVTSLLVRHKHQELEVSAQAFNNRDHNQSTQRPRALVVDDSPSVRKQIELELDLFNVDVDFAESVDSAQSQLDKGHYDVAFLDVVLPDGDGFGICRTIKAKSKDTRVIMLTGKATAADKIKGTMAGCDAYLVKPVGRMTFQNTVCNYLQLREQLEVIHG